MLIRKAWKLTNYKSVKDLEWDNYRNNIATYDWNYIVNEIKSIVNKQALQYFFAEDNILDNKLQYIKYSFSLYFFHYILKMFKFTCIFTITPSYNIVPTLYHT